MCNTPLTGGAQGGLSSDDVRHGALGSGGGGGKSSSSSLPDSAAVKRCALDRGRLLIN